jgi:hypothetical protein
MSALISFDKIDKHQQMTNSAFQLLFSAMYDRYLEKSRAPVLSMKIYNIVLQYLGQCWPEKYPFDLNDGHWSEVLGTKGYSLSELQEWLRALTEFSLDARRGDIDPKLDFNLDKIADLIARIDMQTHLLREEIAALKQIN